jgi:putative hydrolases of HD superfamily
MNEEARSALEVARLVFAFGRVLRVTHEEDGTTKESDTTHTVMISVLASALASRLRPDLDVGKVAQFALVHDLVEAYAGDTDTYDKRDEQFFAEKEAREQAALVRIKSEFDAVYPWIGETITAYESLATPEARFVKVLDKCMPKVTHMLNRGSYLKSMGATSETLQGFLEDQRAKMAATYGADQPEAMAFYDEFSNLLVEQMKEAESASSAQ